MNISQCLFRNYYLDSHIVLFHSVKVADFNMSRSDEQCPDGLTLITSPTRLCRISGARCHTVTYSTINMQYKTVCGTVIGYGFGSTDAFADLCRNECDTIDGPYVDGVSITHGSPRKHIWSFAMDAPFVTRCPCNSRSSYVSPSYVGDDYNCETYVPSEPVWDGQNCMPAGEQCCQRSPMFCKELSEPTTDDIEVRVCTDESLGNEGVAVEVVKIYIQ